MIRSDSPRGGGIPASAYVVIPLLGFAAGLLFRVGADRNDAYMRMYATIAVVFVGLLTARAFTRWQVDQGQAAIATELDRLRARGFRVRPIRWGGPNEDGAGDNAGQRSARRVQKRRARLLRQRPAGWVVYKPGATTGYYVTLNSLPHHAGRRKAQRRLAEAAARARQETSVLEDAIRARTGPWRRWAERDARESGTQRATALPDRLVPCLLLARRRPREIEVTHMAERGVRLFPPERLISTLTAES